MLAPTNFPAKMEEPQEGKLEAAHATALMDTLGTTVRALSPVLRIIM